MNASFAFWFPLKMLHRIRHINGCSINACRGQSLVQQFPSWPDKRATLQILLVPWLLSDKNNPCLFGAFAKNSLRPGLPQRTRPAARGYGAQFTDGGTRGNKRRRRRYWNFGHSIECSTCFRRG